MDQTHQYVSHMAPITPLSFNLTFLQFWKVMRKWFIITIFLTSKFFKNIFNVGRTIPPIFWRIDFASK